MTAYNVAPYVGEAVQSLLSQRGVDLEVIIVNDGSTDGTADVLRQFAGDSRVTIIDQSNRGSSAARNAAAKAAHGTYLAFLDGDDVAMPDRCALSVRCLERHPDAALAYGSIEVIDETGHVRSSRRHSARYKSGFVGRPLRYRNFIPFSTAMVRADVFRALGGFDDTIRSSEDWDFVFRLSRQFPIVYVGECLAKYRLRADAKTSNVDEKERAYLAVQQRIFIKGLRRRQLPRLAHACRLAGLASIQLHRGDRTAAWQLMVRSFLTHPLVTVVFRFEILDMLRHRLRQARG
jgi:glycosyltransferase involved in cell wall biosynthesis